MVNPPASSGPASPPPTPPSPKPHNINNIRTCDDSFPVAQTPYPNKGIILQSLNYIQMDVFSSLFPNTSTTCSNAVTEKSIKENSQNHLRREPAFLSETLYNIENDFRSLF